MNPPRAADRGIDPTDACFEDAIDLRERWRGWTSTTDLPGRGARDVLSSTPLDPSARTILELATRGGLLLADAGDPGEGPFRPEVVRIVTDYDARPSPDPVTRFRLTRALDDRVTRFLDELDVRLLGIGDPAGSPDRLVLLFDGPVAGRVDVDATLRPRDDPTGSDGLWTYDLSEGTWRHWRLPSYRVPRPGFRADAVLGPAAPRAEREVHPDALSRLAYATVRWLAFRGSGRTPLHLVEQPPPSYELDEWCEEIPGEELAGLVREADARATRDTLAILEELRPDGARPLAVHVTRSPEATVLGRHATIFDEAGVDHVTFYASWT